MTSPGDRYDQIGRTYSRTRVEDLRIAASIHRCLGDARSVLNVGAGTGSYEPRDRQVTALDPSEVMIGQRPAGTAPAVRGRAEALPFRRAAFDASMTVLSMHHWSDPAAGLSEMSRVSAMQVVLYFEPLQAHSFWCLDFFPEALDLDTERNPPGEKLLRSILDVRRIEPVLVPRDCRDGFGTAYWARPEAYLDPEVQEGISFVAQLPRAVRERGTEKLREDLSSGAWDQRHGHLRSQQSFDGGLHIAVAH